MGTDLGLHAVRIDAERRLGEAVRALRGRTPRSTWSDGGRNSVLVGFVSEDSRARVAGLVLPDMAAVAVYLPTRWIATVHAHGLTELDGWFVVDSVEGDDISRPEHVVVVDTEVPVTRGGGAYAVFRYASVRWNGDRCVVAPGGPPRDRLGYASAVARVAAAGRLGSLQD